MSQKMRSVLVGIVVGAFLGAAFAWVASDSGDEDGGNAVAAVKQLGPMDYFALGIAILGLARQFGGMLKKS